MFIPLWFLTAVVVALIVLAISRSVSFSDLWRETWEWLLALICFAWIFGGAILVFSAYYSEGKDAGDAYLGAYVMSLVVCGSVIMIFEKIHAVITRRREAAPVAPPTKAPDAMRDAQ